MAPGRRISSLLAAVVAACATTGAARAADKPVDAARAEALFEEGRRLMAARDFASACPKLAESQQLDPAAGTLLNLAVCYERAGKTATAWATYKEAQLSAQRAGETERAQAAAQKASELEASLSRVAIDVPEEARVPGLVVRCDGRAVNAPAWGLALPYDPGPHDVEASAPGRRPWSTHVDLADHARAIRVAVPSLAPLPAPPPDAGGDASGAPPAPIAEPRGDGQRAAGIVLAGIGVIGAGVGAFAGLRAKSTYDDALAACGGGTACPDDRGPALRDRASTWGAVSTIAFAAGGASLAAGALLFFTAPRGSSPSLAVTPTARGAALSLAGRF